MTPRSDEKERVIYEFDAFRVDPVRRLLLRDGEPQPITPKAFSILVALIERAGEVVEKSELIERIWPGAFVTEANLTQNVFSLRKCLGERANDNRYIVTVPGQGYSFAGELRRVERFATSEFPIVVLPPSEPAPAASPTQTPTPMPGIAVTDATPTPQPFPPLLLTPETPAPFPAAAVSAPAALPVVLPQKAPRLRRWLGWGGLGVLALLLIATAVHILQHLGPAPRKPGGGATARRAIAVLDIKSLSPSREARWLETAFSEMLTTELAAGGKMRVISGEQVAQTQRSLALRDPGSLGRADLERLHDALGADLVVVGSFLPNRGQIRLDLRVVQIPGGETVVSLAQVGTQSELFNLVSRTGEELRTRLGVAELSPEQVRQTQALRPSSPESSRLYSEGLARLHAFDPPGALELLQRAAEADPGSAVIHSALSRVWSELGYDTHAEEEARKALQLANSLSREDRLAIQARLYKASKQWDKASETYRSLWTFLPDDIEHGLQLAESLIAGGRNAEVSATVAVLRKLPPPGGQDPRIDLVEARNGSRLSDVGTELRAARAGKEKGLRSGQSLVVSQALIYEGDALIKLGKPQEAVRLFRESAERTKKAGYTWGYGQALANVGSALEIMGDLDGSEKVNLEALDIARKLGTGIGIAAQYLTLGTLHQDRGELAEALRDLDQSIGWSVRIGDRLMETRTLNIATNVLVSQGNLTAARQRCERALSLSQALGDRPDEAVALGNLGTVLEAQGELTASRRRHEEAFALLHHAGNSSSAAAALADSASPAARLGDLRTAWQHSAQAMASKQQAGDRIGVGRVLGLRARLAYQMGDLAASRTIADDQLRIARETGARSLTALALQNRGRADFAAADLVAARARLTEALQVSSSLGEELRATEIRLDLAGLALAGDRAGEAAVLARQAAAWSRDHGLGGGEAAGQSILADALLRQGMHREALAAAERARAQLETSEDRELRITVAVRLARLAATTGNPGEAIRQLRHAAEEAASLGFAAAGLEARLALGEVQRNAGDPAAAATLAAVRKEAETRGFKRLALAAGAAVPVRSGAPLAAL
jgi:DNA-binding winged helix-turn-helix (wHTH) protein/tetratricopeptide (TPR) repeat protein